MSRPHALPLAASGYVGVHVAVAGALAVAAGVVALPASPSILTWVGVAALAAVAAWVPLAPTAVADGLARRLGASVALRLALAAPGAGLGIAAVGARLGLGVAALPGEPLVAGALASAVAALLLAQVARTRRTRLLVADRTPLATVAAERSRRRALARTALGAAAVAVGSAVTAVVVDGVDAVNVVAVGAGAVVYVGLSLATGRETCAYAVYDVGLAVGEAGEEPRRLLAWRRIAAVEHDEGTIRLRRPFPRPDYVLPTDGLDDPAGLARDLRGLVRP